MKKTQYKFSVLRNDATGYNTTREEATRGKLIIEHPDKRPEFIEVDNGPYSKEPTVRIVFENDERWVGTMADLKKQLCLA